MFQHISTPRRRFDASGRGTGSAPPGPAQNTAPMGQCFVDVMGGVAKSVTDNFSGLAGALAGGLAGGTWGGIVGGATTGLINASIAGYNAAQVSEACQNIDNAALANELGLGGIVAP